MSCLPEALAGLSAELIVALNGVSASSVGVPVAAPTVAFPVNRGVSVAWNAAARMARAPFLCILNDDVMLGPASLKLLHDVLATERTAGVVGPVGTRWDVANARHLSYLDTSESPAGSLHECEVVSGFLFATPKRVFDEVDGFDETLTPCGFEEVDYCTAVRRRLGLRCYAVAGVLHSHEFGISSARPWRRISHNGRRESLGDIARRNRQHFLTKWSELTADGERA